MRFPEKIAKIPELIKIENSIFVLPFTYIGMLYASSPTLLKFILITAALISARGAAFAANRYIGRKYDIKNPIKKGWSNVRLYSKTEILLIFLFLAAIFISCAYLLNRLAFMLAPLILLIVILEPYTKRYTAHRHFSMALVIGLGIIGGYIGVVGAFPTGLALYVLLFGYVLFSGGSDIIISIPNAKFDRSNGLKTYPSEYGTGAARVYAFAAHIGAAFLFFIFGLISGAISIIAASIISAFIFILENKKSAKTDANSIGTTFFYYNAAVSLLMLAAFIVFKFV